MGINSGHHKTVGTFALLRAQRMMTDASTMMFLTKEQRVALYTAVDVGEVTAIDALFQCDNVRVSVDATERLIARNPSISFHMTLYWFSPLWTSRDYDSRSSVIARAVLKDQFEVVQWFYSPERIAWMGRTLAYLWGHATRTAIEHTHIEILELLLNVRVLLFAEEQQANQLQELVRLVASGQSGTRLSLSLLALLTKSRAAIPSSGDVLQILLAHGADINTSGALERLAKDGNQDHADVFVTEGLAVLGVPVKELGRFPSPIGVAERLLENGLDVGAGSETLTAAVRTGSFEIVSLLVKQRTVDVDARDAEGRTPLMQVTVLGTTTGDFSSVMDRRQARVAEILVKAGADVTARDYEGKSSLDHAMASKSPAVVELLLNHAIGLREQNRSEQVL